LHQELRSAHKSCTQPPRHPRCDTPCLHATAKAEAPKGFRLFGQPPVAPLCSAQAPPTLRDAPTPAKAGARRRARRRWRKSATASPPAPSSPSPPTTPPQPNCSPLAATRATPSSARSTRAALSPRAVPCSTGGCSSTVQAQRGAAQAEPSCGQAQPAGWPPRHSTHSHAPTGSPAAAASPRRRLPDGAAAC
jgi:hypothetical protein